MPRALATLLGFFGLISSAGAADLAPGDRAPAFTLAGSDGREYRLSDFVGKQGLVLAWFPKAFTAG
jgi:peroxiredoxin Q/BCP